jgi:cell division septation protein DedD
VEKKALKTLTNLLSKTAGLVFFSFLAISLGVVFGLLFDGWVKDQPGSTVNSHNNLEAVDLPITGKEHNDSSADTVESSGDNDNAPEQSANDAPQLGSVKYKVRVGPYSNRDQAVTASRKLAAMGYPVFIGKNPPFAVQVGAFATRNNAEKLRSELSGAGYKSFIEP